jgi:hypothetical protein
MLSDCVKGDALTEPQSKEIFAFHSGGKRGTIIGGIIACGVGCLISWASIFGDSAKEPNAWVGYIMGPGFIAAGLGIITWRAGSRFDPAKRRWYHEWHIFGLGRRREGDFGEIQEIDITQEVSEHDGRVTIRYPVLARIKTKTPILVDYFPTQAASYDTGQKLSALADVPLADHYNEPRDIHISADAIPTVPEPPNKLVTYTVEGKTVTFIVPLGTKQEALGCSGLILACAAIAVLIIFKVIVHAEQYRAGEYIIASLVAGPFVVFGIYAICVILVKAFLMTETVSVSPEGLDWSAKVGPWKKAKHFHKDNIKDVQLRAEKDGKPVEVIIVGARDSVSFGRGLPQDEKVWLASVVCTILGRNQ